MSVRIFQPVRDWRGMLSYTIHQPRKVAGKQASYPKERYVIMGWWILKYGPISIGAVAGADTLEDARSVIPKGYELKPRIESDPIGVVESWI